MSNKKLQIFVSSTYKDLTNERQAVVEAILMSGHIPAGMELFAAGDKSQLETIRRWIKESDVFMLILGGRYGSIEGSTGRSYIQLEYEYALELGKPVFAAVISENYLKEKKTEVGDACIELEHADLYETFRNAVLSKVCRFFDDKKDLKLVIHESIPEVTRNRSLAGWIRGDEIIEPKQLIDELSKLRAENEELKELAKKSARNLGSQTYGGRGFEQLLHLLKSEKVPQLGADGQANPISLLAAMLGNVNALIIGVQNTGVMSDLTRYIFFKIAPKLALYGLVEKSSANDKGAQRFQLSNDGTAFLAKLLPLVSQGDVSAS